MRNHLGFLQRSATVLPVLHMATASEMAVYRRQRMAAQKIFGTSHFGLASCTCMHAGRHVGSPGASVTSSRSDGAATMGTVLHVRHQEQCQPGAL